MRIKILLIVLSKFKQSFTHLFNAIITNSAFDFQIFDRLFVCNVLRWFDGRPVGQKKFKIESAKPARPYELGEKHWIFNEREFTRDIWLWRQHIHMGHKFEHRARFCLPKSVPHARTYAMPTIAQFKSVGDLHNGRLFNHYSRLRTIHISRRFKRL